MPEQFAPAASQLTTPAVVAPTVTAAPAGRQGVSLDETARVPLTVLPDTVLKPPGYQYAYAQITTGVSVTATTSGTANTVVTAPAVVFDGATTVCVEFYSADVSRGTSSIVLELFEDGTTLGILDFQTAAGFVTVRPARMLTPAAGSRTYSVRGYVDAGTGTVGAGAGGAGVALPAYIRITCA